MAQSTGTASSLADSGTTDYPASPWRVVLFGVVALVAGVAFVQIATGRPGVSFRGQVTARMIPLTAAHDGVLVHRLADEGDAIRIGDPIFAISNSALMKKRQRLEQQIAQLEVDLERTLAQAELDLEWRIKDVDAEIFTARLQSADLLEEKYRYEMEKVALTDVLTSNSMALWTPKNSVFDSIVMQDAENQHGRLSAVLHAEAASNSAEVCSAQVEMCEEQVKSLEALRNSLPERVRRSAGVDAVERQLEQARNELALLSEQEPQTTITSPVIGQVGVFLRQPGEFVRMGDRIVEIFDDVKRFVVVDVPSHEAARFTVGSQCPLTFPGNAQRTGRVTRVAPQAIASASGGETVVRLHLEPAGLLWPHVPIESQVTVSVP